MNNEQYVEKAEEIVENVVEAVAEVVEDIKNEAVIAVGEPVMSAEAVDEALRDEAKEKASELVETLTDIEPKDDEEAKAIEQSIEVAKELSETL